LVLYSTVLVQIISIHYIRLINWEKIYTVLYQVPGTGLYLDVLNDTVFTAEKLHFYSLCAWEGPYIRIF
jgi:hypothetical protein